MKIDNKINSFTLSEMLVVMVITTLVVALAFTVLNLVNKQVSTIASNYANSNDAQKLNMALAIDFNSYDQLLANREKSTMEFVDANRKMNYRFTEEYSLRGKDSLAGITDIRFYSSGKQVLEGKVDAIEYNMGDTTYFVFKRKDAAYSINE